MIQKLFEYVDVKSSSYILHNPIHQINSRSRSILIFLHSYSSKHLSKLSQRRSTFRTSHKQDRTSNHPERTPPKIMCFQLHYRYQCGHSFYQGPSHCQGNDLGACAKYDTREDEVAEICELCARDKLVRDVQKALEKEWGFKWDESSAMGDVWEK